MANKPEDTSYLSTWSIICALVALFIFPLGFGLTGFTLGAIAVARDKDNHGIIGMVLSITCGLVGTILGFRAGISLF